jgi:hypothetical protein
MFRVIAQTRHGGYAAWANDFWVYIGAILPPKSWGCAWSGTAEEAEQVLAAHKVDWLCDFQVVKDVVPDPQPEEDFNIPRLLRMTEAEQKDYLNDCAQKFWNAIGNG